MKCFFFFLFVLAQSSAFAAYDSSWHQTEFWSGEYPNGISVVKEHTKIMGRSVMDLSAPAAVDCELPYKAVFHPWNLERATANDVHFYTASKIVNMTAKENFAFVTEEATGATIAITKGQLIEFLIYFSEGYFGVRIHGVEYTADQSLFEKLEEVNPSAYQQDEWFRVTCVRGQTAWIFTGDLVKKDDQDQLVYIDGISGTGPGLTGYGSARDLTEEEAIQIVKDSK